MPKQFDEIRELLIAERLEGLSGQGVSEGEMADAERQLGVVLPPSYTMFLKEHGWGYFGSLELICGLGSDIPTEWEAGANLLRVVADERQGPICFPHDTIPICQNGAGDWYAIDCSQNNEGESPVVFVAHEEVATMGFRAEPCKESFADWIHFKLSESP